MPCDYEIDTGHRLVRCRAWGELTHTEATANRLRFTGDPAFRSDFSQLFDLRDVTIMAGTIAELQEIASHSPFGSASRRAIIAADPVPSGFARMFQAYREAYGGQEQIEVFTSPEDAEKWLGLKQA